MRHTSDGHSQSDRTMQKTEVWLPGCLLHRHQCPCTCFAAAVTRSQARHAHVLPDVFHGPSQRSSYCPACTYLVADMDRCSSCSAAHPREARGDGDERDAKAVTVLELATPTLTPGSHSDGSAQTPSHIVTHEDIVDDKTYAPASAPVCPGHEHLRLQDPRVHIQKVPSERKAVLEFFFDGDTTDLSDLDPYRCAPAMPACTRSNAGPQSLHVSSLQLCL